MQAIAAATTTTTTTAIAFWVFLIGISMMGLPMSSTVMAEKSSPSDSSGVYIVYTEKPDGEAEPHHLNTLSTVLPSEQAAKEALLYTYTNAATGFSAKLTPRQAEDLSKQPGVLQVVPSRNLQLHSGGARMSTMQRF